MMYNLDPLWSLPEQEEVSRLTTQFGQAISEILRTNIEMVPVKHADINCILADFNPSQCLVFNWCENVPGVVHSEWMVAGCLERNGFTFTGASAASLALAQNKYNVKKCLQNAGIPTPRGRIYTGPLACDWDRFPAIVKAVEEHCSEGIDRNAVVMNAGELKNRIDYIVRRYRQPALVEDFIDGREVHISLLGDGDPLVLPPAEMEFSSFPEIQDRICSYESKFVPSSESYEKIQTILPASLEAGQIRELHEVCKAAYMATGCRDYARLDLRVKDGVFYVLDVNPNADLSPDTTTVSSAEYTNLSYGALGAYIIYLAAQRHPLLQDCISMPGMEFFVSCNRIGQ